MRYRLIVLADKLDELDMKAEANILDGLLQKLAKEEGIVTDFDEEEPTVVDPLAKVPISQMPTKEQTIRETQSPVSPEEEETIRTKREKLVLRDAYWALKELAHMKLAPNTHRLVNSLIEKLWTEFPDAVY